MSDNLQPTTTNGPPPDSGDLSLGSSQGQTFTVTVAECWHPPPRHVSHLMHWSTITCSKPYERHGDAGCPPPPDTPPGHGHHPGGPTCLSRYCSELSQQDRLQLAAVSHPPQRHLSHVSVVSVTTSPALTSRHTRQSPRCYCLMRRKRTAASQYSAATLHTCIVGLGARPRRRQ